MSVTDKRLRDNADGQERNTAITIANCIVRDGGLQSRSDPSLSEGLLNPWDTLHEVCESNNYDVAPINSSQASTEPQSFVLPSNRKESINVDGMLSSDDVHYHCGNSLPSSFNLTHPESAVDDPVMTGSNETIANSVVQCDEASAILPGQGSLLSSSSNINLVDVTNDQSPEPLLPIGDSEHTREAYNQEIMNLIEQNCSPGMFSRLQSGTFTPSECSSIETGHVVDTIFKFVKPKERARDVLKLPPPFFKQSNRKRKMKHHVITSQEFIDEEEKIQAHKNLEIAAKKRRTDFFDQKKNDLARVTVALSEKRLEMTKLKHAKISFLKGKKKSERADAEKEFTENIQQLNEEIKELVNEQRCIKQKSLKILTADPES